MSSTEAGPDDAAPDAGETRLHVFTALAFEENLSLKEVAPSLPGARLTPWALHIAAGSGGDIFLFPFGAAAFREVNAARTEEHLGWIRARLPSLSSRPVSEEFVVTEAAGAAVAVSAGRLTVDRLTRDRASVVALVVAQSASMEYYEKIVERLFERTSRLVERLQTSGTVPMRMRPLHRFIGEAVGTRSEVLAVLHLLDKPDATWDDPAMDRIYDDLRGEFDLADRYAALEAKLRAVQEALELVLDVARDRRLVLLESTVVFLILLEIVLAVTRAH